MDTPPLKYVDDDRARHPALTPATLCRLLGLDHTQYTVLHAEARVNPASPDEHALVDPAVASVTGLQTRSDPKILIVELGLPASLDCRLDGIVHIQNPVVSYEDEGAIVGLNLGTHVEPAPSVWSDEDPIAASGQKSSRDALSAHLAFRGLE